MGCRNMVWYVFFSDGSEILCSSFSDGSGTSNICIVLLYVVHLVSEKVSCSFFAMTKVVHLMRANACIEGMYLKQKGNVADIDVAKSL